MNTFEIREIKAEDREWICRWMVFQWGAEYVIAHDEVIYPADLSGFIACDRVTLEPKGLITFRFVAGDCEIITLDSLEEGLGIGTTLIEAVMERARREDCHRLWLVTTNDNLSSLRFYQKRGFRITRVNVGAVDRARQQKPEIPEIGDQGIQIRDEIELELMI